MTGSTPDPLFLDLQTALAGRYSLLREIGRGGMGIVYLAREVRLDRLVALKLLPPALAAQPALRERFLREARLAAGLSHPHIIPILAADEVGAFVFFAMNWIEGETLGDLLRRRGRLGGAEAARLMREVAWGLAYAHRQGVIHRDIKPDNVLVEQGTGRAVVADFGIARVMDQSSGGHAIGTPAWMSPEQAAGEAVDGRSDLFALGVIAFQMLAGRLPFGGEGAATLAQRMTSSAPPLASVAPDVPGAMAAIVDRCLARQADDRFPSAEALAEALDRATARPAALPAPLQRWAMSGERLKASDAFLGTLVAGPLFLLAELAIDGIFSQGGFDEVLAMMVALLGPMTLYAGSRWRELRRVLREGYTRTDLARALRAAARAPAPADEGPPWTAAEDRRDLVWRGAAAGGAVIAGWTLAGWVISHGTGTFEVIATTYMAVASVVVGWKVLLSGRHSITRKALDWRARFWDGAAGRLASRLATLALKPGTSAGMLEHRPTEIGLAVAADALFAALPATARAQVPGLPDLVRRLEARAEDARTRGDEPALAAAVAALENIRLDLLRMSAGGSGAGMTTDLDAVRRLGDDVDAVISGEGEARRVLDAPTPA